MFIDQYKEINCPSEIRMPKKRRGKNQTPKRKPQIQINLNSFIVVHEKADFCWISMRISFVYLLIFIWIKHNTDPIPQLNGRYIEEEKAIDLICVWSTLLNQFEMNFVLFSFVFFVCLFVVIRNTVNVMILFILIIMT